MIKNIRNSEQALRCLDNKITGRELYSSMDFFTYLSSEEIFEMDFDVIITILRAGLPLGLSLYKLTNIPLGFISAKRHTDLTVEITYKNIPEFKKPLIVDSWIATGSTIKAVCEHLNIDNINLFGLVASKQALELIEPKNYVIGYLVDEVNENNYIVPPPYTCFKPRDGGDDLFVNINRMNKR